MFETGTPRIAEAIGWGAAVEWPSQFDMREVHAHIHDIASWTADQMLEIPVSVFLATPIILTQAGRYHSFTTLFNLKKRFYWTREVRCQNRSSLRSTSNGCIRRTFYKSRLILDLQHIR